MLAATLALIGGVQVLAPGSAAAMDDLDPLSDCREDEDLFFWEIEEDCSDEESGGGGGSGGGEPSGGGSSDGDSADDLCANYGVNCSGGSGDSGNGGSTGSGGSGTSEPPPGCVDYAWGHCLDDWEEPGTDPTKGPNDSPGGADPCAGDPDCGSGGRGPGGGSGGGGGGPSGPVRQPARPPDPCAGYSRAYVDTLYPHPTPEQEAESDKAYDKWRRCVEDTPRGSIIIGRAGGGTPAAARLSTAKLSTRARRSRPGQARPRRRGPSRRGAGHSGR